MKKKSEAVKSEGNISFAEDFSSEIRSLITLRKFSMSEALPVIFFLHFGHSSWFKPNLIGNWKF